MPSYYDSTKTKPGLAEIKYQAGGKVNEKYLADAKKAIRVEKAKKEALALKNRIAQEKRDNAIYNREYRKSVREYTRRQIRGKTEKGIGDKVGDWSRKNIGKRFGINISGSDEARMQARKDILGFKKGGKVKKMSKGGQLKVRGMGAATRGGNFSRNG